MLRCLFFLGGVDRASVEKGAGSEPGQSQVVRAPETFSRPGRALPGSDCRDLLLGM